MQHLKRGKTGYYYFRQAVPARLREAAGKREIVAALGTQDPARARYLSYIFSARVALFFAGAEVKEPKLSDILESFRDGSIRPLQIDRYPSGAVRSVTPENAAEAAAMPQILAGMAAAGAFNPPRFNFELIEIPLPEALAKYASDKEHKSSFTTHIFPAVERWANWHSVKHPEAELAYITGAHMGAYKSELKKGKGRNGKAASIATVLNRIGHINAFFSWAQKNKHFPPGEHMNPCHGLTGKAKNSSYRPFTDEEIKLIFAPEQYKDQRLPHAFWPGLLAAYTGARLDELASLRVDEIRTDIHGVWIMSLERTGTKASSSSRRFPLHPALIELGFLDYCADVVQATGKRNASLFPYLADADKAAGRMWRVYLVKIGLKLPTTDEHGQPLDASETADIVFHGWRHTVAQALSWAGVPKDYEEHYIGHLPKTLHDKIYSRGDRPMKLYFDFIERYRLPLDIKALKYQRGDMLDTLKRELVKARARNNSSARKERTERSLKAIERSAAREKYRAKKRA